MHRVVRDRSTRKDRTVNGITYDSGKEAAYAERLTGELERGEIAGWQRQEKIDLRVNGYHISNYYIDFTVTHNDGTTEYVEVKGWESEMWRFNWRLFEAIYSQQPNTRIKLVK